ncbi:MAG: type II toxin-antitoxin system VapB family antitoxin [Caulobacteraceae bacterium]
MPLYIKDDQTTNLVTALATLRGVSKKEAVRLAVKAELAREAKAVPLAERLERFWSENPPPPPTKLKADKRFFDELWGET